MMFIESLDKSISTAIAVGGVAAGLWAHRREMVKERHRLATEAQHQYAESVKKEYAAQRDFGHIKRDLDQLKINTAHISNEYDQRLDAIERKSEKMDGSIDLIKELIKHRMTD